jgi:hypothetical protein
MKQNSIRWAALAALAFGLGSGASASAFYADPLCYASCQEQMNDCLAQVPAGQFRICARQYRECLAACEQQ